MDLREQLDAQLKWGNEAQDTITNLREDARLYNVARKEALAERDAAWERIKLLEECRAFLYCVDAECFTDDCVLFDPSRMPDDREEATA